jgi:hypothetical protein
MKGLVIIMTKVKRIVSRANIDERLDYIVKDINMSMPLTSEQIDNKLQLVADMYEYDIIYHISISENGNIAFDNDSYIKIFTKNFGVKYNKFDVNDKDYISGISNY